MFFKNLKDKCEYYRGLSDYRLVPNTPVIAMVDGHCFSKLIKKRFNRPFDDDFINMMNETAAYVCQNVQGCKFAYVQSDEISFLITDYDTPETDSYFGYRLCKMQSLIASMATAKFNSLFTKYQLKHSNFGVDETMDKLAIAEFDCKVWSVPTKNDAYAWFLWRQNDCIRNSKQQAAQSYLPHKVLLNKHTDEQVEMLKTEKGIDWYTDFNDGKKYGRILMKVKGQEEKDIARKVKVDGATVEVIQRVSFEREVWTPVNAQPFGSWVNDEEDNFIKALIPDKHE